MSVLLHAELAVKCIHANGVPEDQREEGKDGSLLGKPETERVAADLELVKKIHQQNPATERHREPDKQAAGHQTEIGLPVRPVLFAHVHPQLFL